MFVFPVASLARFVRRNVHPSRFPFASQPRGCTIPRTNCFPLLPFLSPINNIVLRVLFSKKKQKNKNKKRRDKFETFVRKMVNGKNVFPETDRILLRGGKKKKKQKQRFDEKLRLTVKEKKRKKKQSMHHRSVIKIILGISYETKLLMEHISTYLFSRHLSFHASVIDCWNLFRYHHCSPSIDTLANETGIIRKHSRPMITTIAPRIV